MEAALGEPFDDVRVHVGPEAQAVGALAFTRGSHLCFAPGNYDPDSPAGRELIGHELAHVVQQRQGRARGDGINSDPALEAEADRMGRAAASHGEGAAQSSAGAPSSGARATVDSGPIQRKVGFELELNVILRQGAAAPALSTADLQGERIDAVHYQHGCVVSVTDNNFIYRWNSVSRAAHSPPDVIQPGARDQGRWVRDNTAPRALENELVDPRLDKTDKLFTATNGDPFDVVEDHAADAIDGITQSIIEIVTDARDEFGPVADFLLPLQRAEVLAANIDAQTNHFQNRIPASRVMPGARSDLHLGTDVKFGVSTQNTNASVQASFGVQLAGVPRLMQETFDDPHKRNGLHEKDIIDEAMKSSAIAAQTLGWQNSPSLVGLLHLAMMYLCGGKRRDILLDKNHSPFLIRCQLSAAVASCLTNADAQVLNHSMQTPENVIDVISGASGRNRGQKLFLDKGSSPSVGDWIRGVFAGTGDAMAAAWGLMRQIAPEDAGPAQTQAMVLEERQVCHPEMKVPVHIARSEWVNVARRYYDQMHAINRDTTQLQPQRPVFNDQYTPPPQIAIPQVVAVQQQAAPFQNGISQGLKLEWNGSRKVVAWEPIDQEKCRCFDFNMGELLITKYDRLKIIEGTAFTEQKWVCGATVKLKEGPEVILMAGYSENFIWVMQDEKPKKIRKNTIED